ncbi:MAG: TetR-like C-terminal domain-containing protein [Suipraeoptans sp.]
MDIRIKKTKKTLKNALLELCQNKELKEITVSELCKKASINRTTFYKYYTLPQDILQDYIDEMFQLQVNLFGQPDSVMDKAALIDGFAESLEILLREKYAYQLYMKLGMMPANFIDRFLDVINPHKGNIDLCYFISGGMSALITRWLKSGCRETPREMAEIIYQYVALVVT